MFEIVMIYMSNNCHVYFLLYIYIYSCIYYNYYIGINLILKYALRNYAFKTHTH